MFPNLNGKYYFQIWGSILGSCKQEAKKSIKERRRKERMKRKKFQRKAHVHSTLFSRFTQPCGALVSEVSRSKRALDL